MEKKVLDWLGTHKKCIPIQKKKNPLLDLNLLLGLNLDIHYPDLILGVVFSETEGVVEKTN